MRSRRRPGQARPAQATRTLPELPKPPRIPPVLAVRWWLSRKIYSASDTVAWRFAVGVGVFVGLLALAVIAVGVAVTVAGIKAIHGST